MSNIPPQDPSAYQQPGFQQPAYEAAGMAPQPAGYPAAVSQDARTWAMLSHIGALFLGFLAPLIVMLTKGNEDPFTRDQAVESLNFQITVAIAYVVSLVLMIVLIGFLTFFAVFIAHVVLSIMGGLQANKGIRYRYPFALRLVK